MAMAFKYTKRSLRILCNELAGKDFQCCVAGKYDAAIKKQSSFEETQDPVKFKIIWIINSQIHKLTPT